MRRKVFILLALLAPAIVNGWTVVTGTWTSAGSPYYFYDNLIVPDGEQLVVEPGVFVYLDDEKVLKIEGNLLALGAEGDSILFKDTPGGGSRWGGLIFDSADSINVLDYVRIFNAVGSPLSANLGGDIYAENSILEITNCRLEGYNPNDWTLCGGGVYIINCPEISVENTLFHDCHVTSKGGGIYAENCPSVYVLNSDITYCRTSDFGGGAYIKNCPQILFKNCYFNDCGEYDYNFNGFGGGIYFDSTSAVVDSCWFENCRVDYGLGSGIYFNQSEVEISRTVFINCFVDHNSAAVLLLDNRSQANFDHSDVCFFYSVDDRAVRIFDPFSTFNCSNSIFYAPDTLCVSQFQNNIQITYSIAQEFWPGAGNLVGDPFISDSCQLSANSPCIDAGDPNFPLDPDSTRTDMGAFYFDGGGPMVGPVSGVWTSGNSPYVVGGDIYIPAGDTLIMEPGTVVEFSDDYDFNVYGILLVEGSALDSVIINGLEGELEFHSLINSSSFEWTNMTFDEIILSQTATLFNHCSIHGRILAEDSWNNELKNCFLDHGVYGGSNWSADSNYISIYCYNIGLAASIAFNECQGIFTNNEMQIYASATPGMWFYDAWAYGFQNCEGTFIQNTIYANASAGNESSAGLYNCIGTAYRNMIYAGHYGIRDFNGHIENCTIKGEDYGIMNASGLVKNCIVYDCNTGFSGSFEVQYSCVYDCNTPYSGVTVGPGNIREDPLLVNWYYLSAGSPCIDAGDPASPPNPDGTRADMGANYFDQGPAPISISLSPHNPPIQIPAGGGSFQYDVLIENTGSASLTFDAWIEAVLPDSSIYGPILLRENLALSPGSTISREDMTQFVPAGAPPGVYDYFAYTGTYPGYIFDSDSFPFEKLPGEPSPLHNQGWTLYGWEDDALASAFSTLPTEFKLHAAYPNPFNPTTTLSFALPEAGDVSLVVYDIQGREVSKLVDGWRSAGEYQTVFDGSKLSSGIYFARLIAGSFSDTQKLLLLK